jgi:superfamily II RNA helicase
MVKICTETYPTDSEYFGWYPYPLSDFQKWAIEGIATGNHVLVTAHTGSGKTLPAEFAIRYFTQQGKKVIYTAPIKALSNQKYYDFTQKFPDITFGLMTGDIKTNPTADVLIMTTEILQNYLFLQNADKKGSVAEENSKVEENSSKEGLSFQIDIHRDLACVIFDEVHYINDADRGQVWEKTILLLPLHVQMVMLSATIDAPEAFASWCENRGSLSGETRGERSLSGENRGSLSGETRRENKIVYLAPTTHRVVPLSHYGFLTTVEGIFKGMKDKVLESQIRDGTNKLLLLKGADTSATAGFQETAYYQMKSLLDTFDKKQMRIKRKHLLNQLVLMLRDREMLPAIAFVFSRKHVEMCAHEITVPLLEDDSKVPYIVARECETILRKLPNYREYLVLPEYISLVSLLEKGIAIHHSGMLPILREMVELAISRKYVKLLFATESFAIGLDCPIKTAIFTSLQKFDGHAERTLHAHEYTQMAGRAGRRGIDTVGHVVHCNQLFDLPSLQEYKTVLGGKPQALVSKFMISFDLILNLVKNGQTRDFHTFMEKSMIFREIQTAIEKQRKVVEDSSAAFLLKQGNLGSSLMTPLAVCKEYIMLEDEVKTAINKRRKDLQRRMEAIIEENRYCVRDAAQVRQITTLESELSKERGHLEYLEDYLVQKTDHVVRVLIKRGFLDICLDTNDYILTSLGQIASQLAEIPGVLFAELLQTWDFFREASVPQIVGILSCITDIKVSEEVRVSTPAQVSDPFVKRRIQEMMAVYTKYADIEADHDICTGTRYEGALGFDLVNELMEWTHLETEAECRELVARLQEDKGVSLGEFTKGILKLNAMAKEIATVLPPGETETLKKVTEIEGRILKYVATTQSLYI